MEIIPPSQKLRLLEYTSRLRHVLAEWLIVEVKITDPILQDATAASVSKTLADLYKNNEGLILICSPVDILMLIHSGKECGPQKLAKEIGAQLPSDTCEATVVPPTKDGLKKLVLSLAPPVVEDGLFYSKRMQRKENIILIADDDMYLRSLLKAGLKGTATIVEIGEGDQVAPAYQTHNPDMVLLDIHMPGLSGQDVLAQLKAIDPRVYVVMLSADSSVENVKLAKQYGAKGFLAKPFDKKKLLEYVHTCPTLS